MPSGTGFYWSSGRLEANLATFETRVQLTVSALVDFEAARSEGQMKTEARWTDRTSAARTGLHATTFNEYRAWTLVLAHAVNYGIWLETRNDFHGKYAIILPVLIDAGNRLMANLEGLFGKMV